MAQDVIGNRFKGGMNIIVGIAQNSDSPFRKSGIAFCIGTLVIRCRVLNPVKLDCNLFFGNVKIDDIAFNNMLPFYGEGKLL